MTGTLALVGGAEWSAGCEFDRDLLEASGGREVLVAATAAAYENPGAAIARAEAWFAGFGATVRALPVYDRAAAGEPANVDVVAAARFVYFASGSAMHLRSVLKSSPLWDAIVAAHEQGAVVAAAGSSADVLCDAMVDPRGGGFGVGLGLVVGLSLIPRFDQWSAEKSRRTIDLAPAGLPLAGIPDRTALVRDAGGWRVAGVGTVRVFRAGEPADLTALPT